MRHTLPVLLVLLVIVAAAGCAPAPGHAYSSSAPVILAKPTDSSIVTTPAQIQGVWQIFSTHCNPGYMIIRDDGTYTWSCQPDGSNGVSGKYHFANGKFVLLNDICGAEGRYQVSASAPAADPRTLTFTLLKDSCEVEIKALTSQKAVWVAAVP